jgi:hypothetical protein
MESPTSKQSVNSANSKKYTLFLIPYSAAFQIHSCSTGKPGLSPGIPGNHSTATVVIYNEKGYSIGGLLMRRTLLRCVQLSLIAILSACGPQPENAPQEPAADDGKPPAAIMTIGEKEQVAGVGTYCWPQAQGPAMCADALGIPTAQEAISVSSPFTAHFEIPVNRGPAAVQLTVIPVGPESEMAMQAAGYRWWEPRPGESFDLVAENLPAAGLDLEPGLYVLSLFVSWQDFGDASYGFLVQVV